MMLRRTVVSLKSPSAQSLRAVYSINIRAYSTASPKPLAYLDYGNPTSPVQRGITFLTLNRPEALNAINSQMLDEMAEAVEKVQDDGRTHTLILNSLVPRAFCSGADLKERHSMTTEGFHAWHSKLGKTFKAIEQLPFPVIAAIDGLALGGGLELALCADLRVAGPGARKLGLPEVRHAIIPGAGGTQRLSRLVGPARAKHLILTGRIFNREWAYAQGIIDELGEEGVRQGENAGQSAGYEAGLRRALVLAEEMGHGGPLALQAAKAAIDRGYQMDINTAYEWERTVYKSLFKTKDREEGLMAFKEKRPPVYIGE